MRDPLAEAMLGPGGSQQLETVEVAGYPQQVFTGAPRNLAGLYQQAMGFGDRLMVVQDDQRLTYDEAFSQAAALADALRNRYGIKQGSKVAVVTSNRIEWIVSVLAITAVGAVAALVNSRGVAEEMLRAIATADCELVIMDADRADIIAAEVPDPVWPRILIGAAMASLRVGKDADYTKLSAPRPGLVFAPDVLALGKGGIVLFTSGTTGFPKAALISQGALAHSVAIACFMGLVQDARYEAETGEVLPPERRSVASPRYSLISPAELTHNSPGSPMSASLPSSRRMHT